MARLPVADDLHPSRCEHHRRFRGPLGMGRGRSHAAPPLPGCHRIPKQMLTAAPGGRRAMVPAARDDLE